MQEQAQELNEDDIVEDAPVQDNGPAEDEHAADCADDIRVLEALLFASAEPLTTNAIRGRMDENADVGGLLMRLKEKYEGCGIELLEMDGSWAFRTAGDLGEALQVTKEVQRKLSRAAMETLAIIAYHQPVTRAEIENIRGVATNKGTLDVLMEIGWVKPGRRRETPGRPLTWMTTTAFMDHFGLESMSDLPGLDDLKASGLLDRRPAIDTIPGTGELFEDDAGEDADDDDEDDDVFEAEFAADDDSDDSDYEDGDDDDFDDEEDED